MSFGEIIAMLFFGVFCAVMGGFVGGALTVVYFQIKQAKKIDKFLRNKLKAGDYLDLQDFLVRHDEDSPPMIIFLRNKLNEADFKRYVELAEIKDINQKLN